MSVVEKRHLLKSAFNFTQAGQWDRALDEYRKVIQLFPDDANIHSMVADLLAKRGDPAASAKEHMEAARLFKAGGADDKELNSLKRALRVQAGHSDASAALLANLERAQAQARKALAEGRLEEAEAVAQRMLDADPGHLAASRLLDDVKAARLAEEARLAMEEEAGVAASGAGAGDAASEVISRLDGAVQGYLAAEDFDNAIETLMVMLKLDPGRASLQAQLADAQGRLTAKQSAQAKWQALQAAQAREIEVTKAAERAKVEQVAWGPHEEALQKRLEQERRLAEETARQEQAIVENAVKELKTAKAPEAPLPAQAPAVPAPKPEPDSNIARLAAEERAKAEQERKKAEEARLLAEQERLRLERENADLERRLKEGNAAALKEMEARMEKERAEQRREMEQERARLKDQETGLQAQLRELMRSEMERLQASVREQTLKEVEERLALERQAREALEAIVPQSKKAPPSAEALAAMNAEEDKRKQELLDEALKRRQLRQGGEADAKASISKNSRRISDVLHAATTRHIVDDVDAMIETAHRYLRQDLLLDALRICQKVAEKDPENEKVKGLLKVIYEKKGI